MVAVAEPPAAPPARRPDPGRKPKPAPKPSTYCEKTSTNDKLAITLSGDLHEDDSEIKAILPEGVGTAAVCVNSEQQSIADEKTPKKFQQDLAVKSTNLDVVLPGGLHVNQDVAIVWTSGDGTWVVKKETVRAAKYAGIVNLTATPKEGQDKIMVDTSQVPSGATGKGACMSKSGDDKKSDSKSSPTPVCLRVYVNGDLMQLVADDKGTQAEAVLADPSGSQGITLKTVLDAGECVAVVAYQEGHPPEPASKGNPNGLRQDDLQCDSKFISKAGASPATMGHLGSNFYVSGTVLTTSYFDFGRVRGYLAGGSLFSYDAGSFSSPSIFLDFNVTKNWLWGGPYVKAEFDPETHAVTVRQDYKRVMFETFFDARLTSLPVAACNSTSSTPGSTTPTITPGGGTTTTQTAGGACPSSIASFVSSRKAATLTAGASIPIILTTWKYQNQPYGMSIGPLAKIGLDTPLSSGLVAGVPANTNQFYTNFGFGGRLALYRMSYSPGVAPDNVMYIDVVSGRFSNFDVTPTNPDIRYARPYRFGFEGILKVPNTPFFLGFSANIHQNFGLGNSTTVDNAKDDLRFLFGAKFDAGKLFSTISAIH